MQKLTREAMGAGVRGSSFVLLFLSEGVLTRPFVQFEVGEALRTKTPVILMHEPDLLEMGRLVTERSPWEEVPTR